MKIISEYSLDRFLEFVSNKDDSLKAYVWKTINLDRDEFCLALFTEWFRIRCGICHAESLEEMNIWLDLHNARHRVTYSKFDLIQEWDKAVANLIYHKAKEHENYKEKH